MLLPELSLQPLPAAELVLLPVMLVGFWIVNDCPSEFVTSPWSRRVLFVFAVFRARLPCVPDGGRLATARGVVSTDR